MTYRGRVHNGVVEFQEPLPLDDGTDVEVRVAETAPPRRPPPGSPEAILSCGAHWHGDPAELDRLLAEIKEAKWAEVRARQAGEA